MRTILETIFDPLNAALAAIPLSAARWITVAFLILPVIGAAMLKSDYIFLGARRRIWYLDLRIWAGLCMIPYILIYFFF